MTAVADASAVVALLVDNGPDGAWAEAVVAEHALVAPHLLPVEVANILRRAELHGDLSTEVAAMAFGDLGDLAVDLVAFEPVADRVWELRHTVTAYDAWYVALAEALALPLATLDRRLASAPGLRCEIPVPPPS